MNIIDNIINRLHLNTAISTNGLKNIKMIHTTYPKSANKMDLHLYEKM
jgi:hypothetical protein